MLSIVTAQSDNYTTSTQGNLTINWTLQEDKSNYKQYTNTITNNQGTTQDVKLRLGLATGTTSLDLKMEIWANITKATYQYNLTCAAQPNVTLNTCVSETNYTVMEYEEITPNGTFLNSNTYNEITLQPNQKLNLRTTTSNYNPILYSEELGIKNDYTTYWYHPIINSTTFIADFITDKSIASNMTIVSSTNINGTNTKTDKYLSATCSQKTLDFASVACDKAIDGDDTGGSSYWQASVMPQWGFFDVGEQIIADEIQYQVRFGSAWHIVDTVMIQSKDNITWTTPLNTTTCVYVGGTPEICTLTGFVAEGRYFNMTYSASSKFAVHTISLFGLGQGPKQYDSVEFDLGDGFNKFTPQYQCTGVCTVNLIVDGETFLNVSDNIELQLASGPVGNTLFNYTIILEENSEFQNFEIDFVKFETENPPIIHDFSFLNATVFNNTPLNVTSDTEDNDTAVIQLNYTLLINGIFDNSISKNFSVTNTTSNLLGLTYAGTSTIGTDTAGLLIESKQNQNIVAIKIINNAVQYGESCHISKNGNATILRNIVVNQTNVNGAIFNLTASLAVLTGEQYRVECKRTTGGGGGFQARNDGSPVFPLNSSTVNYLAGSRNLANDTVQWVVSDIITSNVIPTINGIIVNDTQAYTPVWNDGDNLSVTLLVSNNVSETISLIVSMTTPPVTPPPPPLMANFTCIIQDDICIDGKFKCLLAGNNETILENGEAFDIRCNSLNIGNPAVLAILYIIALVLIFLGFRFNSPLIIMIGGLLGVFISVGIIHQYLFFSIAGIFFFSALIFAGVFRGFAR